MTAFVRRSKVARAAAHRWASMMEGVALLLVALIMGSCETATAPSPTPPRPDTLAITPFVDALKLGETQILSAVVVSGDGTRRPMSVSWSSDSPDVVAVSDDGRVRALKLGTAQIHATSGTLSALASIGVVPDYAGSWSGEFHIVGCTRLSGGGSDVCRVYLSGNGVRLPLSMVLTQSGSAVSGTLSLYSTGHYLLESGPVDGTVDHSNTLVLSAYTKAVDPSEPSETVVSEWMTTLADDGVRLTGRFTLTQTFRNIFGLQVLREQCELMNVTRSP